MFPWVAQSPKQRGLRQLVSLIFGAVLFPGVWEEVQRTRQQHPAALVRVTVPTACWWP